MASEVWKQILELREEAIREQLRAAQAADGIARQAYKESDAGVREQAVQKVVDIFEGLREGSAVISSYPHSAIDVVRDENPSVLVVLMYGRKLGPTPEEEQVLAGIAGGGPLTKDIELYDYSAIHTLVTGETIDVAFRDAFGETTLPDGQKVNYREFATPEFIQGPGIIAPAIALALDNPIRRHDVVRVEPTGLKS